MSDDFIPFNQSTPVHGEKRQSFQNRRSFQNNNYQQNQRRSNQNRWNNSSFRYNNSLGNSSFGSDNSNSFGGERSNIDAYLHPSMLQDPWAQLRQKMNQQSNNN